MTSVAAFGMQTSILVVGAMFHRLRINFRLLQVLTGLNTILPLQTSKRITATSPRTEVTSASI